jgi:predicted membrane-bound spermidine synthase
MNKQRTKTSLLFISVLPFLSGAAALSHELLWTRRLVDVLGATDWVVGRVLGLFFLGLSLGGFLATLLSRDQRTAIKRLALAEIFVAILALPAVFLPYWTDWIWMTLGEASLVSWQGSLIKLLIAGVVVLPPSIAMGCTLPFFVRVATSFGRDVDSSGIWVYSLNTLGGVFGLWLTSSVLLQWFGAQQTMLVIALANGLIALIAWSTLRFNQEWNDEPINRDSSPSKHETREKVLAASPSDKKPATGSWSLYVLAFMSGFIVLAFEVLLLRLIALVVPSSYHTTSALLANVILILGFSSLAISLMNTFKPHLNLAKAKWLMIFGLAMATILIGFCPVILFESTDKLVSLRYLQGLDNRLIESVNHFWILVFGLIATTSGLALVCCGFIFPSIMTISSERDASGKQIGLLLAANGIGGLLGCELFNSWILGRLGIYQGFSVLAVLTLIATVALLFRTNRWFSIAAAMVLGGIVFLAQSYNNSLPYYSVNPKAKTKFTINSTHFGPEGVLLVATDQSKSKSILVNSQYVLGSTGVAVDQRRQLLLPWLIQPEVNSVCSLGLATGISASGLEQVDDPPPITAVELSFNVSRIAETHFNQDANGFFDRGENKVVVEDARIFMAAVNNEFDLIVGDLYRPHGMGEGRLFSVEHFTNVRDALTDDGLFCQWLPIYQLNEENFLTIAATFQNVFPETLVVFGNENDRFPVLGLMGRKNDRPWKFQQLENRIAEIPAGLKTSDPLLERIQQLIVGRLKDDAFVDHRLNTLDNLEVEINAGNFWILKDLRRNRPSSYQSEFLSRRWLKEFNQRLETFIEPINRREEL